MIQSFRRTSPTPPFLSLLAAILLLALRSIAAAPAISQAEKLFVLEVKPLLVDKCFPCHGKEPQKIKGDLNLLTRQGMLNGGETSDQVLVPGNARQSLLYLAVTWTDPDYEMPPKENDRLTEQQTWYLRDWINGGAPWPDPKRSQAIEQEYGEGLRVQTSGGLSDEWTVRRYDPRNLWPYQPITRLRPPQNPATHPIDAFIIQNLRRTGLPPAPLADRLTLLRRATFDLIGLPPTPHEVQDFLSDPASDQEAFGKVVERLLASPHYGEQWARHWLDVARYADSSGFANDYERGNAWRYRDYVIRSFNQDKPYDQFVREQIAGDEIDPDNPEMLIAAGFLRMGSWELTGMEVPKVARQRFLDDITDSLGQVFLSHPLQCARCHDHKFDPIPTRDYYRLQAVFATTQMAERKAPFLPEENTGGFGEQRYLLERKKRFEALIKDLDAKEETAARNWHLERSLPYIPRDKGLKSGVSEEKLAPNKIGYSVEDFGIERIAHKGLERLRWELDRYQPYAFSVYSGRTPSLSAVYAPLRLPPDRLGNGTLEPTAILAGGDPFSPIQEITPGVLSLFPRSTNQVENPSEIPPEIEGRRVALASWVASPRNPLTVRSIVNRVWQWHFGRGLAGNPNNFGATGKKPIHPELLDWLCAEFIHNGWSLKSMHRLIMSSETYRRASRHPDPASLAEKDPDRATHAVFQPRRLSAEELRDSMLIVSGELNPTLGGIPVRPEMNLEAALQPRMVMGTFATAWQPSPSPSQRHRRSIYALKIRGQRDPFLEVFNQPSPELSCEGRDASAATPQVFSLFNSQHTHSRSLALASRLKQETHSREAAVQRAFTLAFGRSSTDAELLACLEHWREMTALHSAIEPLPPQHPREIVREAVEENTGEKFRFTEVLDFYQDFVPDLRACDADADTRGLAEVCLVLFNSNEFIYIY